MSEIYNLVVDKDSLVFLKASPDQEKLVSSYQKSSGNGKGAGHICRMGDPDILNCLVLKKDNEPGGIFIMHDKNGILYSALAETALAYSLGLGFFGQLTANARYGVDVFENLEIEND